MRARLKPSSANGLAFSLQAENSTEQALLTSLANHPKLSIAAQPDGSVLLTAAAATPATLATTIVPAPTPTPTPPARPNYGKVRPNYPARAKQNYQASQGTIRTYRCTRCDHEQSHSRRAYQAGNTNPVCGRCGGVLKRIRPLEHHQPTVETTSVQLDTTEECPF